MTRKKRDEDEKSSEVEISQLKNLESSSKGIRVKDRMRPHCSRRVAAARQTIRQQHDGEQI